MNESVVTAIRLLSHPTATKRTSGAKRLRKLAAREAGPALLTALGAELADARTWSTQYHLILALGVCNCAEALPLLRQLSRKALDSSVLYQALGDAIFRLMLESKGLTAAIEEICQSGNFQLMHGAFHVVAIRRLVPDAGTIRVMISRARDPGSVDQVQGYPGDTTGIRQWVAAAAASWDSDLVREFLLECQNLNDDSRLRRAAENSLEKKHVDWGAPY
jgi:hypothetical protein